MRRLLLALMLTASPASAAETAAEIGGEWHLIGLEGHPATAPLSITFSASGKFSGKAPCNRFFGTYSGDLSALSLGPIGATKMACPNLAAESAYFEALTAMQSAEITDNHMFLIGPEGRLMEFTRLTDTDSTCLSCMK